MNFTKLRLSLSAIATAAAMMSAPASAAPVFNEFTVDPTIFGTPVASIQEYTANKLSGLYEEALRLNNDGTFDVAINWIASSAANVQEPPPGVNFTNTRTGLGFNHVLYALFSGTGTVVATQNGTEFVLDAGGVFELYADDDTEVTGFNFDSTTWKYAAIPTTTADEKLAFGAATFGEGNLDAAINGATCGTGTGINCGSFGQTNTVELTDLGKQYFTWPIPFYNLSFVSGQFNDVDLLAPEQFINGSLDLVFDVPEPGSLALVGLALSAAGLIGRRSRRKVYGVTV